MRAAFRSSASIVAVARGRLFSSSAASVGTGGQLFICGTGESNKLGVGDTSDREVPTLVESLKDTPIVHVSAGRYHSAAISASGDVYAWGLGTSGQLGLGSYRTKAPTPQKVEALSGIGVRALSCGLYHTLALTDAGEVYSFGFGGSFINGVGGLGSGSRSQLDSPAKLEGFTAASISAGGYHSVAKDAAGDAWSWGRGEWGRLGHGDSSDCYEPTLLEVCDEIRGKVATCFAGDVHTAVLTSEGAVYAWGRNENWQLGYEVSGMLNAGQSLDAQQEPQMVVLPTESPTRILSCGELGTAALSADGSVYVWGMGRFFEPTILPSTENIDGVVTEMSVGAYHLGMLTDSGKVYTYGTGPSLALPRTARQSWELLEVTNHFERRVLGMSCGPYTTALIVAN